MRIRRTALRARARAAAEPDHIFWWIVIVPRGVLREHEGRPVLPKPNQPRGWRNSDRLRDAISSFRNQQQKASAGAGLVDRALQNDRVIRNPIRVKLRKRLAR